MTHFTDSNQGRIGTESRDASVAALWPVLKHIPYFRRQQMKNITTPRTLADSSFHTGYPTLNEPRTSRRFIVKSIAWLLFAFGCLAYIAYSGVQP